MLRRNLAHSVDLKNILLQKEREIGKSLCGVCERSCLKLPVFTESSRLLPKWCKKLKHQPLVALHQSNQTGHLLREQEKGQQDRVHCHLHPRAQQKRVRDRQVLVHYLHLRQNCRRCLKLAKTIDHIFVI